MKGKHFSGTQNASPISTEEILSLPKGNNFLIHVTFILLMFLYFFYRFVHEYICFNILHKGYHTENGIS